MLKDYLPFDNAVSCLGAKAEDMFNSLPKECKAAVQEIRIRRGLPICLVYGGVQKKLGAEYIIDDALFDEMIFNLCEHSVYSKQNDIANGFITVGRGHRAGLCGRAVIHDDRVSSMREFSSIVLRVANEHLNCADAMLKALYPEGKITGLLVAGAPCSGKTTILRDAAAALSSGRFCKKHKVVIIDERGEIAGVRNGRSEFSLEWCDVLTGFNKAEGILQAVRCLSPDVIVCDEIGGVSESRAVSACVNTGVCVLATVHAGSREELLSSSRTAPLLRSGAFLNAAMLHGADAPGRLYEIIDLNEYGERSVS